MKKLVFVALLCLFTVSVFAKELLTLDRCKQMAIQNNQKVKASNEEIASQKSSVKSSFTHFLPRVTGSAIYQQQNESFKYETPDVTLPVTDADGNVIIVTDNDGNPVYDDNGNYIVKNWAYLPAQTLEIGNTHNYAAALTLTQPLFTGGKLLEQYKSSRYKLNMAEESHRLTEQEILQKTEEYYWQVISLQAKVELAHNYRKTVKAHFDDLNNYLEEGFITRNELLQASVKYEQANLKVLQAENGLILSKMALNQIIGFDFREDIELKDTLDDQEDPIELDQAKDRPELAILRNSIKIVNSLGKANVSRYLPNLVLEANYFWLNPNPYNSMEEEFGDDWTIGVVAEWDIFHWFERGFDAAAISHQRKALEYQFTELDQLTNLELEQARQRLEEADQSVISAKKAVEQAQINLTEFEDRFSEGLVASTDVLDAQTLWLETKSSLIDAKTNHHLQQTALRKALGSL